MYYLTLKVNCEPKFVTVAKTSFEKNIRKTWRKFEKVLTEMPRFACNMNCDQPDIRKPQFLKSYNNIRIQIINSCFWSLLRSGPWKLLVFLVQWRRRISVASIGQFTNNFLKRICQQSRACSQLQVRDLFSLLLRSLLTIERLFK